ncbi:28S ribosomal protein S23, mitochondrial [Pararge aegeria]|uniref:Small ribosomal subunit protein mS23 n=1 Tax=Pararge aegeria aegeria TaxID=348720 RepID=A0A8S4SJH1_9NEOP|nr:28S ribosomal protein S23, mitochondrial [Pararge aegeria]CAH2266819.1 jg9434 [Pararge aegeria aegeria]
MATSRLERIGTIFSRAEGLLLRGAIRPDDRPLWFDVYKAFPPTVEPKYARPKPENLTIKPILYKEDVIRAKFHAKGHGLNVNMLSLTGETQTKKLVQKYQQLQSEGVAEEELVQKSAEAVGNARQATTETYKVVTKIPDSVTAKVLAEADLKNIFKDKE